MEYEIWDDLRALLAGLWRGGAYGYYWFLSADGKVKNSQWFALKKAKNPDPDFSHCHQYFSIHPSSQMGDRHTRAKAEHIAAINCFFADFDAKDTVAEAECRPYLPTGYEALTASEQKEALLTAKERAMMADLPLYKERALALVNDCPLPPSWVNDTGGGYQLFWFLAETIPLDESNRHLIASLQAAWVNLIAADRAAKDLVRVFRCPNTFNNKPLYGPDYPLVTVHAREESRRYALADFIEQTGVDEAYLAAAKAKPPQRERVDSVIATYNAQVRVGDILTAHGYQRGRSYGEIERYSRPGRDATQTSVVVWRDANCSYHHSSNDALYCNGHTRDPFDVTTVLDHNGDATSAYVEVKKQQGLWEEHTQPSLMYGRNGAGPLAHESIGDDELAEMPPLPAAVQIEAEAEEGASPWLDDYMIHSRQWSPRSYEGFHENAGLFVLSTVAAGRAMLHFGGRRYTNLSIAFTARTSAFNKTSAVKISAATLADAKLLFLLMPDDATPQAFMHKMAENLPAHWSDLARETQLAILERLAFAGQRGWYFDEFGQKLAAMMRPDGFMADFRGLLRRLDDCPPAYEYATMGRGSDAIQAPYLALLASLTPDDLKPFARQGAALWRDGFLARIAFVAPPPNEPDGTGRFPRGEMRSPAHLVKELRAWHERLGVPAANVVEVEGKYRLKRPAPDPRDYTMSEAVRDAFYHYHDGLLSIVRPMTNHDLDGSYVRLAEKALRVALLLASLQNSDEIKMRHWARAQRIAEDWRRSLHNVYAEITAAPQSRAKELEEKILALITKKGPQSKREIYTYVWGLDSQTANVILTAMVNSGLLQTIQVDGAIKYALLD